MKQFFRHKRFLVTLPVLLLLIGGGVFWYAKTAFGVTRTWDGGGTDGTCGGAGTANNWTCASNWSADTVPTGSDIATFDATSTKDATINANISVAGINIAAGYSGIITQSSTYTVTVGSSHFVQAAGTFTGGSGLIDVNGIFTLSGGTFTSTAGTLEIGRSTADSETVLAVSGGTFNHNNGTVKFVSGAGNPRTFIVDVLTTLALYNVESSLLNPLNDLTTGAGDTVIVVNDFTLTDGQLSGTWEAQGNITIASTADGGIGNLTYTGTGSKTYTYSAGGIGPNLRVNTASGTLSPNTGTTDLKVWFFTLLAGTFIAPSGTMEIGRSADSETIFTVSGGTFNHNNGTVKFVPTNGNARGYTIDVATSLTLYNIELNSAQDDTLTAAAGDTVIAAGNFIHTNGILEGTWEVQGNVTIGSAADGGGATLTMTGTGSKTYTYTTGGTGSYLRVNNAALSVTANTGTTDLKVSLFAVLAGTFIAPTGTLEIGRDAYGETVFTVSAGTFNHNNGTVKFISGRSSGGSTFTVDVATTQTFYNIEWNSLHVNAGVLDTAAGDTVIAANNFIHTNGQLFGVWQVQGNYTVGAGADGGSAGITFTGGNNQTYTDNGGNEPDGDVTVNKSGGTVTLASGADWNAASQDLTITAGTLSSATYNITTNNFTVNGGTFTGGSGTVTTAGPMFVSSGIFTGGAGNVTVNNTYTLSGGTFTSTSGTLQVNGNFTHTAGGTFNHNSGTVILATNFAHQTADVSTSETFYNFTASTWGSFSLTISSGDTLIVLGTFTHTDGNINTGTIEARGNVVIGSAVDGGSATITFLVSGDQTITGSGGGSTCAVNIGKSSGTVSVSGDLGVSAFTLSGGTFTAPSGTLQVNGNFTHTAGGTFNHNSGTVILATNFANQTADVSTSETFYNFTASTWGNFSLTISSGDTLIVLNTFTYTDGNMNTGTIEARGNVVIGVGADGGSAMLSFTGPNDQTYTDNGGNEPDGNITINKPVGTVLNLASNADWNAASQTTTITSGILNIGSYTLRTGGTLTVSANGVLHDFSTGDLVLGGTVSNSGIIRLESSGSCGSTDSISITSSVGATQRAWSGSGVFTLWDTSIQDQGGTAKVQVNSGTSVSGNGTNFVFNSACNFANNNASLTNGLVGYWPMEENTGTSTADMSGNGNDGTLTLGPTWTTGKIGNAVNFDGTDDYVNIPSNAVYDTANGTWALWVKFDSTPITNSDSIMSRANTSASWNGINLVYGSTGTVAGQFKSGGATVSQVNASQALNDGTWHHISLVFSQANGGTNRLYIDGVESGSSTNSAAWTFSNQPVRLADAQDTYWEIVDGQIDEVRIYNRALTATEVQQLYYNVRPSSAKVPSGKFQITNSKLKLP